MQPLMKMCLVLVACLLKTACADLTRPNRYVYKTCNFIANALITEINVRDVPVSLFLEEKREI